MEFTNKSVFEVKADYVVVPVNLKGVMGAGFAKAIGTAFPTAHNLYIDDCKNTPMPASDETIERVFCTIWATTTYPNLIFFPTKRHWIDKSRLDDIERGLEAISLYSLGRVAMPRIGCGLGGLQWEEVEPLIDKYLDLNAEVIVCDGRIKAFGPVMEECYPYHMYY